jgi:hypothetical protein
VLALVDACRLRMLGVVRLLSDRSIKEIAAIPTLAGFELGNQVICTMADEDKKDVKVRIVLEVRLACDEPRLIGPSIMSSLETRRSTLQCKRQAASQFTL